MIDNLKAFKAMSDETRIKILILLSKKNICAKGIAKHLEISEAAVSQHIKVLKEANLITGFKSGYHVLYDLNKQVLYNQIDFLKVIINEDLCSINNRFNIHVDSLSDLKCKKDCKVIKNCCNRRLKEELQ